MVLTSTSAPPGGVDGVPLQIEGVFAPGGTLEMDSALVEGRAGHTVFLKAGHALYRVGDDAIRIGPGAMEAHHVADAQ